MKAEIERAARLAGSLNSLNSAPLSGGHWRLFRTLALYVEARTISDNLERLHQYCRCIEGLILPRAGDTKRQFKSRTELFIGPRHHKLMDAMYEARNRRQRKIHSLY